MKLIIVAGLLFLGYRLIMPKSNIDLPHQYDENLEQNDDAEFIEHEEVD